MKKIYLLFTLVFSVLIPNFVSADSLTYSFTYNSSDFEDKITFYNSYETEINALITYWEDYFSPQYPYFYLNGVVANNEPVIVLYFSSSPYITFKNLPYGASSDDLNILTDAWNNTASVKNALISRNGVISRYEGGGGIYAFRILTEDKLPLINHGILYNSNSFCYYPSLNSSCESLEYTDFYFPSYENSTLDINLSSFTIIKDDLIPDYLSLYNGSYNPIPDSIYEEIDLNDYSYVILSLKDYTSIETQFSTTIYTLGSLCLTPVYDYGMKQKQEYYTDYHVQGCTDYYNSFTPVSFYILPSDVNNHAVYYIKSSNYNISNIIKVNKNLFDITYLTSSNEDNPQILIDGRSYPGIPYDELTDTAIISTQNGYISGESCQLGDINCQISNTGFNIESLFSNPLDSLKSVWSAITSFFVIIGTFIALLPSTLQSFLLVSFALGLILGLLKILL